MDHIELPPFAPTLMESTRAIGYSLETAIADIVDNSIAARAKNVWIEFFPSNGGYISVLDDGEGMDSDELLVAMQYGSKNPHEKRDALDLGRFGLGLKTASLSQCKKLTVLSKKDAIIEGRRWDLDYIAETENWTLLVLDDDEMMNMPQYSKLETLSSGTIVIWQELDRLKIGALNFEASIGRKMDEVREHLALVYHRYLQGEVGINKIKIKINDVKIDPIDPFVTEKSTKPMEQETLLINGEKVYVQPYILPHSSKLTKEELDKIGGKEGLRRQQGFYIYRNKRLLVWGTWFRMMRQGEHSKLVRVMVDIPNSLDSLWTLDIKKSTAVPPEEVKNNLKSILDLVSEKGKRTWTIRGKKEVSDDVIHVWDRKKTNSGGYIYEINKEHPLVCQMIKSAPVIEKNLLSFLRIIESEIPLNRLYLDLTGDEKIENESESVANEVMESLENILSTVSGDSRQKLLNEMLKMEPFSKYGEEIKRTYDVGEQ